MGWRVLATPREGLRYDLAPGESQGSNRCKLNTTFILFISIRLIFLILLEFAF